MLEYELIIPPKLNSPTLPDTEKAGCLQSSPQERPIPLKRTALRNRAEACFLWAED